ncbi:MAG UNVERIFIED_CONTAM: hypothetical protein LVR18_46010 [Planctomycetaceae bacterium]
MPFDGSQVLPPLKRKLLDFPECRAKIRAMTHLPRYLTHPGICMAAAIDVQNVTKTYDDLKAVDSISLTVPRGPQWA